MADGGDSAAAAAAEPGTTPASAGSTGSGSRAHYQHHVRGTPYHVRPGVLRLALVVAAVFLAFPALSTPLFRSLTGAEQFPQELVLALLVSGAGAWAVAAFTASSAWLALGLGGALAGALRYLGAQGLVPSTLTPAAAAPLLVAGVLSAPGFSAYDPLLALGLLAGAGSQGLFLFKGSDLPAEVTVLTAATAAVLLASPGIIGLSFSRALSPLASYPVQGLAAALSLALAAAAPSVPAALTAALTAALLVARALSTPPEPTEAARQNARASHWLLSGLLATLAAVTARGMDAHAPAGAGGPVVGVAALGLLLLGAGVSVLVTALLAATAAVWGPVRSGEFQMVTLDFLALCAYFVAPLLFVWHLAAQQLAPHLPQALPAAVAAQFDRLRALLGPLLPSHPLAQLAALALLVVAGQEALEESSIIWAHWLIRTYTLGRLDTKRVALVAPLGPLLAQLPPPPAQQSGSDEAEALPALLQSSGIAHLNVLVGPELVATQAGACRALAKAGHTLVLETAAGPFALPTTAMAAVSQGHAALQALLTDAAALEGGYSQGLSWYAGRGGHRNPWALWRASRLNLHFVAPVLRVTLGDNAGRALRERLDPWCKGGIVAVDLPPAAGGDGEGEGEEEGPRKAVVNLAATLADLAAQAKAGGYELAPLSAVCPEVQRMALHTEE